jgi:pyridoxamine 5'-phosphate oxidase
VISSREVLESRFQELMAENAAQAIARPPYWGGYRLSPTSIEFWQGQPSRLHDRLRYRILEDGSWLIERLSP